MTDTPANQHETTDREAAALVLAGYIRGMWERYNQKPDPIVLEILKTVGCPTKFLPVTLPEGTQPPDASERNSGGDR